MPVLQEIEDNVDIEKLQPKFENVLILFRQPVTINELPDYYHIKYPMNLRNVNDRLTRGYYKKQRQFKADMARFISNCRSQNIYISAMPICWSAIYRDCGMKELKTHARNIFIRPA